MFHLYHVSQIQNAVQFSDNAMVGSYFQKVVKADTNHRCTHVMEKFYP